MHKTGSYAPREAGPGIVRNENLGGESQRVWQPIECARNGDAAEESALLGRVFS
jgi:hypothetical protein